MSMFGLPNIPISGGGQGAIQGGDEYNLQTNVYPPTGVPFIGNLGDIAQNYMYPPQNGGVPMTSSLLEQLVKRSPIAGAQDYTFVIVTGAVILGIAFFAFKK